MRFRHKPSAQSPTHPLFIYTTNPRPHRVSCFLFAVCVSLCSRIISSPMFLCYVSVHSSVLTSSTGTLFRISLQCYCSIIALRGRLLLALSCWTFLMIVTCSHSLTWHAHAFALLAASVFILLLHLHIHLLFKKKIKMKSANWCHNRNHHTTDNSSLANPLSPLPTHPFRCPSTSKLKLRDLAIKMQVVSIHLQILSSQTQSCQKRRHSAARRQQVNDQVVEVTARAA